MSDARYDPTWVEDFYDAYGTKEWGRLADTPEGEIQFAIHRNALSQFVNPGDRVLEIGAGPGRFSRLLSELETQIVVGDISSIQLDLNRSNSISLGYHHSVEEWLQMDICDLSRFEDHAFDAVVAFGGPLSYVLDQRTQAFNECLRVTKPGGVILISVMCLWGTIHRYLEGVLGFPSEDNQKIALSGDLTKSNSKFAEHQCHMFRSEELAMFVESNGARVELISSCGGISSGQGEKLLEIRSDEQKWNQLMQLEILACQSPGFLDSGTHLLIACRRL